MFFPQISLSYPCAVVNNPITGKNAINDRLLFTEVNADTGLGRVLQKNQTIVADSLHDAIAAVRHGNGRDWWIVIPRGTNRQFWKILLTPEGLKTPTLQTLPPPYPPFTVRFKQNNDTPPLFYEYITPYEYDFESWAGQATFSPDGTKYCRVIKSEDVEIYDFDRCSGELALRRTIPLPPLDGAAAEIPIGACGLCVSPNSRYLYFNNGVTLYQFDMCAENIAEGDYRVIAKWDGYFDPPPFATNFFQMRNAPDGKIYMASANTVRSLHVIHEPNMPGQGCRFEQHAIHLPRWTSWVINYFPNFNLYDLADSPCDTLGIDDPNPPLPEPDFSEFILYPNPANQEVNLFIPECQGARVLIWNMAGQLIEELPEVFGHTVYPLEVGHLPAGVYVVAAYIDDKKPVVRRLVISH